MTSLKLDVMQPHSFPERLEQQITLHEKRRTMFDKADSICQIMKDSNLWKEFQSENLITTTCQTTKVLSRRF